MPKKLAYEAPVRDTSADVYRRRQRGSAFAVPPPPPDGTRPEYPTGTAETQERDQNILQLLTRLGIVPQLGHLDTQLTRPPFFDKWYGSDPASVVRKGERREGEQ